MKVNNSDTRTKCSGMIKWHCLFFYWNKQSIMLCSHVLCQTLNANQKQMCMKHTLLINTHLIVYRIMNWKNKHAHSDICYWQPENAEDTPHAYTYIHRSAIHTCMHIPTNQPRSVAQAKKNPKKKKSTWIPLSLLLSQSTKNSLYANVAPECTWKCRGQWRLSLCQVWKSLHTQSPRKRQH